jgi:hypothetical protein
VSTYSRNIRLPIEKPGKANITLNMIGLDLTYRECAEISDLIMLTATRIIDHHTSKVKEQVNDDEE